MGFKISSIIKKVEKETTFRALSSKKVAIDAFNTIYQFVSVARRIKEIKGDDKRAISVAIVGFFNRNVNFLRHDIRPIYAFEGSERVKERGDSLAVTVIEIGKMIVQAMGIPSIYTNGEGEAQASYIANKGDAWACASRDYDALLFGAKRVVMNLTHQDNAMIPKVIELIDVLSLLGITHAQLVDMSVLIGSDFYEGVKGIGAKRALDLVRKYETIEGINKASVKVGGKTVFVDTDAIESARSAFMKPKVTKDYAELRWQKPNYDVISKLLVGEGCPAKVVDDAMYALKKVDGRNQKTISGYFR